MKGLELASLLSQVSREFFAARSVDALLEKLLHASIQMTQGDRGALFLVPEPQRESPKALSTFLATGIEGRKIELDVNRGIGGYVFRNAESVLIHDVQSDPRFYAEVDKQTGYKTLTLIAAPLRSLGGICIGAIEILNSKRGAFQEEDLRVLEALASYASIAIEYAHALDKVRAQSRALTQQLDVNEALLLESLKASSSPRVRAFMAQLPSVAAAPNPVWIRAAEGDAAKGIAFEIHSQQTGEPIFFELHADAVSEWLSLATRTSGPWTVYVPYPERWSDSAVSRLIKAASEVKATAKIRWIGSTSGSTTPLALESVFRHSQWIELPPLAARSEHRREEILFLIEKIRDRYALPFKEIEDDIIRSFNDREWPRGSLQLLTEIQATLLNAIPSESLSLASLRSSQEGWFFIPDTDLRKAKERLENELIARTLRKTGNHKGQTADTLGITREGLRKALKRAP